jgi:hypothetical protein
MLLSVQAVPAARVEITSIEHSNKAPIHRIAADITPSHRVTDK